MCDGTSSEASKFILLSEVDKSVAMAALLSKTPVSVLQELVIPKGSAPKYELIQIEGETHCPTFSFKVTVSDVTAIGVGRTKKDAKHAAAKAILDKLLAIRAAGDCPKPVKPSITSEVNSPIVRSSGDDDVTGNSVGALQEMCMTKSWPPPKYEELKAEGEPHDRRFTIECVVSKYRGIAVAKTKKLAKRQAAFKVLQQLKDGPLEPGTKPKTQEKDDVNDESSYKVPDLNCIQLLQDIAAEQNFEVSYTVIEEVSVSGERQCMVHLSNEPDAICYGTGATYVDAQVAAAMNALEFLEIMTRKSK